MSTIALPERSRWTVLEEDVGRDKAMRRIARVRCRCGTEKTTPLSYVKNGQSLSCGCLRKEVNSSLMSERSRTHGQSKTRLYHIWKGMRQRCTNPNDKFYPHYGGRGIAIEEEWGKFLAFKNWADSNGYDDTLTIDRIDIDGDYGPNNCEWVTRSENTRRANRDNPERLKTSKSKVTGKQAREMIRLREQGTSLRELGETYGCSISQASRIVKKQLKTVGYGEG